MPLGRCPVCQHPCHELCLSLPLRFTSRRTRFPLCCLVSGSMNPTRISSTPLIQYPVDRRTLYEPSDSHKMYESPGVTIIGMLASLLPIHHDFRRVSTQSIASSQVQRALSDCRIRTHHRLNEAPNHDRLHVGWG